jgi:hypothetical protein
MHHLLSREVVKFLISLILAQATEVFFEKCLDERRVSKCTYDGITLEQYTRGFFFGEHIR